MNKAGKGDVAAQRARYRAKHPEKVREYKARYKEKHRENVNGRRRAKSAGERADNLDYPFLDGESWNDADGTARLVYLSCYSPRQKRHIRLESEKGIGTFEALTWMVNELPGAPLKETRQQHSLIAWYFGGYDLTLILRDLPAWLHWLLLHPEKRRFRVDEDRPPEVQPIRWRGFYLDWMNNMFTIENKVRRVTVYDIARYYQCSFLRSLKDWQIGNAEELKEIERGKAKRASFDESQFDTIKSYCDTECVLGSELWRKLREAHDAVDLRPAKWFGPGQTAKALLTKVYAATYGTDMVGKGRGEVRWKREIRHARLRVPQEAWTAFASAFFGGRFENSRYGAVNEPTWTGDIASAYPDALRQLPCLVHGAWHHEPNPTRRTLAKSSLACVRYRMPASKKRETLSWAPLPFRAADGGICYPVNAFGWAWRPEIDAAFELGFKPELLEAWVFDAKCKCPVYRGEPSIHDVYMQRILLGKEGPGMVLKFALNSCYGVKAQVLGIHEARSLSPFQSFVEAGMITSLARAKLLRAMAHSPADVLMVNTDSITTLTPFPLDETRTSVRGPDGKVKSELGAWDVEENEYGVTLIKQGIYFDRDFKKLKARGIGRDVLQKNSVQIERALAKWIAGGEKKLTLKDNRDIFHGQRQCTQAPHGLTPAEWGALVHAACNGQSSVKADAFKKRAYYGRWSRIEQQVSFETLPKRERVLLDGRLVVRDMGGRESAPYAKALAIAELVNESRQEELTEEYLLDFPDFESEF